MTEKLMNPQLANSQVTQEELYTKAKNDSKNIFSIGYNGEQPIIPISYAKMEIDRNGHYWASFEDIKDYVEKNPTNENIPKLISTLKGTGSLDKYGDYSENSNDHNKGADAQKISSIENIVNSKK